MANKMPLIAFISLFSINVYFLELSFPYHICYISSGHFQFQYFYKINKIYLCVRVFKH